MALVITIHLTINRACFTELDDLDRCKSIEYLGHIPCASSGSLTVVRAQNGTILSSKCSMCENRQQEIHGAGPSNPTANREAILTFSKLIKSPAFLDSRRPRVLAMITLRKFAVHFQDDEFIDLEISSLGQWCLQSLQSSIRELRIAAGYVQYSL